MKMKLKFAAGMLVLGAALGALALGPLVAFIPKAEAQGFSPVRIFQTDIVTGGAVAWPSPNIQVISTAAPAAGAESVTTVPAGKRWRLLGMYATLTTSATVATRIPSLVIDDGTNVLFRTVPTVSGIAASTAVGISASTTGGVGASQTGVIYPQFQLPDPATLLLQPGWRIRWITTAIDAADQWSIARLVVDER